jgi:hypothetical protein
VVGQNVSCDRIYRDREKEEDKSGKRRHWETGDSVRSLAVPGCEFHRKNCVSALEYWSDVPHIELAALLLCLLDR